MRHNLAPDVKPGMPRNPTALEGESVAGYMVAHARPSHPPELLVNATFPVASAEAGVADDVDVLDEF